jgi:dephospho-CoA kinase
LKIFGLTGGIGMGKSTAANLLRGRGLPVVDTDDLARQLVEPGQPALQEIRQTFGAEMTDSAGRLLRSELARLVFRDAGARRQLEGILHPRIRDLWQQEVEQWGAAGCDRGVVVIPLLFETAAAPLFDAVICVACSAGSQRRRLQQRGWDARQIRQRLDAQWPVEKKMELSHYVVWTEGEEDNQAHQLGRILG